MIRGITRSMPFDDMAGAVSDSLKSAAGSFNASLQKWAGLKGKRSLKHQRSYEDIVARQRSIMKRFSEAKDEIMSIRFTTIDKRSEAQARSVASIEHFAEEMKELASELGSLITRITRARKRKR